MIIIKDGMVEVSDVSAMGCIEEWLTITDVIIKNLANETNQSENFVKHSMISLLEDIGKMKDK